MPARLLAIAVASGKAGYVVFVEGQLVSWGMSRKASHSVGEAIELALGWFDAYAPDAVVTRRLPAAPKGTRAESIIIALQALATEYGALSVPTPRPRRFKNKYDEADWLTTRFPELAPYTPKHRPYWKPEPPATILFEALALAVDLLDNPGERLAAAMG